MFVVFTKDSGLVSRIVRFIIRGPYSHCGVVINGENYQAYPGKGVFKGPYVNDPKIWDEVILDGLDENKALEFIKGEIGCGYDYFGAARFLIHFLKPSKKNWFCSELSGKILQEAGWDNQNPAWKFNPSNLYSILTSKEKCNIKRDKF
jgi:hypothetical protein